MDSKTELDEKLYKADSMEVLKYENVKRSQGKIEIVYEEDDLALRQVCYSRDDGIFVCERVEVGWLIMFIDQKMNNQELEHYISTISIKDISKIDGYVPRTSSYELHEINVTQNGNELINYIFDPYCA